MANVDPNEIAKFSELAHRWWDPNGEFRPLHDINPLRLGWIEGITPLAGKKVLDVGCGGGILAEGMAALGAEVTGIDLSEKALNVAKLHLLESGFSIDYRRMSVEEFLTDQVRSYDVITCMEMLEHVPDPMSVVKACANLLKPSGNIFFSTINRNLKSYLCMILGAEYILRFLPKGTHEYTKFLTPAELLKGCYQAGLVLKEIRGMRYSLKSRQFSLSKDCSVNYFLHCKRD